MKPAPFEYHAPQTLEETVRLLTQLNEEGADAKILAGGQSLIPMLAMRVARPEHLIDLRCVPDLDYVREQPGGLVIGAMTLKRVAEDSELVQARQPLFHAATRLVADRTIRNRGTVGGSFAHADPASEYPAVALVLGAQFTAVGPAGRRRIAAAGFFVYNMTPSLEPREIRVEVELPELPAGAGWAIQEFARRHGDLALVGVVAVLGISDNRVSEARLAAYGVGATALRLTAAEEALHGGTADVSAFARAAQIAARSIDEPTTCVHARAEYRRALVQALTERTLDEAMHRAA